MAKSAVAKKGAEPRGRILKAAETLFSELGYHAASIEDIAHKAGITKSLIYYYFKSKGEILQAMASNLVEESISFKQQYLAVMMADPEANTRKILDLTFNFMEQRASVLRILFMESVKKKNKFNFLGYMDSNFQFGLEYMEKKGANLEKHEITEMILYGIFLAFAPIIVFILMKDEWCAMYRVPAAKAKEMLLDFISEDYTGRLLKWIA